MLKKHPGDGSTQREPFLNGNQMHNMFQSFCAPASSHLSHLQTWPVAAKLQKATGISGERDIFKIHDQS